MMLMGAVCAISTAEYGGKGGLSQPATARHCGMLTGRGDICEDAKRRGGQDVAQEGD